MDPGDACEIEWWLVTLADMALPEVGPWYDVQDPRINFAQALGDAHDLKASGSDLMIDVVMADGRPDPLRLSLPNGPFQGWEAAPAETRVPSVTFPGMAGIPPRVCLR